jgi:hypothetical protein
VLVRLVALLLALPLCGMLSPHLIDKDPFSFYNISLEFLAAFDFGDAFGFDGNGDGSLFSFGSYNSFRSYEYDYFSCEFSVERYVRCGCQCRC